MEAENIKIKPASENRKLKLIQGDAGRPPAVRCLEPWRILSRRSGGNPRYWQIRPERTSRPAATQPFQLNVGSFTRSFLGTDSKWPPALRQAARPPMITNVENPLSLSRCATRALVASRAQVQ